MYASPHPLGLAELAEHGVDRVERGVDLLADLRWSARGDGDRGNEQTFAPVKTILPETKMSKTILGLIMQ